MIVKTQILVKHAVVLHAIGSIERFFEIESLGTNCNPKCSSCICGTCQPGGKNMSIQEEEELRQIEENISFNKEKGSLLKTMNVFGIKTQFAMQRDGLSYQI